MEWSWEVRCEWMRILVYIFDDLNGHRLLPMNASASLILEGFRLAVVFQFRKGVHGVNTYFCEHNAYSHVLCRRTLRIHSRGYCEQK
jgi:hypothetical protein